MNEPAKIRLISTCPASNTVDGDYVRRVRDTAEWSERAGCEGILVYTDNGLVDPWLVAQLILQHTETIAPLVAVQPAYMHPYSVAKMVTTLGTLHNRSVWLNMVAGGFKNDLVALDDNTPHDRRYDRLVEYTTIVTELLAGDVVTFEGEFYCVRQLKLTPALKSRLFPLVTVSGSSPAGVAAAAKMRAVAVEYPEPAGQYQSTNAVDNFARGLRIGIIARADSREAWQTARQRFPEDRKGEIKHQLAMKVSDSHWHKQLSQIASSDDETSNPYWLVPFQQYRTFCPYLVGSYDVVIAEVSRYVAAGYRTIILDVPTSPQELEHIGVVLRGVNIAMG